MKAPCKSHLPLTEAQLVSQDQRVADASEGSRSQPASYKAKLLQKKISRWLGLLADVTETRKKSDAFKAEVNLKILKI